MTTHMVRLLKLEPCQGRFTDKAIRWHFEICEPGPSKGAGLIVTGVTGPIVSPTSTCGQWAAALLMRPIYTGDDGRQIAQELIDKRAFIDLENNRRIKRLIPLDARPDLIVHGARERSSDTSTGRLPHKATASPTGLKAIETVFNGYRFRSRLEARWAVFFDTLGIPFEYEPEGFDLDGLWYLPDFWLPSQQYWIEIKPTEPSAEESLKMERLVAASRHIGFICHGDIPFPSNTATNCNGPLLRSAWLYDPWEPVAGVVDVTQDYCYEWCECSRCGYLSLQFDARADRGSCACPKTGDWGENGASPRLMRAYTAARQARFARG